MKKLYIYAADTSDYPYSELELSESPSPGNRVYAVVECPDMESVYGDVLRLIRWAKDLEDGSPVNGCPKSARVICTEVCDALLRMVRVPFICRRAIDTEFADGADGATKHGMKSAVLSYTPSDAPFRAIQS